MTFADPDRVTPAAARRRAARPEHDRERDVDALIRRYTVAAMAVGAIPVPAASAGIIGDNLAMIAHVGASFGMRVTLRDVLAAAGAVTSANAIGRAIFVEGARLLGWGTGPLGVAAVSVLGAATAGLQTWVIGHLAVALCLNGGEPLAAGERARVVRAARRSFAANRGSLLREVASRAAGAGDPRVRRNPHPRRRGSWYS